MSNSAMLYQKHENFVVDDYNNFNNSSEHFENPSEKKLLYRFLVPQPAAGGIIGRKGENIKRLRSQYNCDVSVPASEGPERLMLVTAIADTLRVFLADVLDMVKDCMHARCNDPKDIINNVIPDNNAGSHEMDLRFLVSENVCGAIIGKGGEVIRRLTEAHKISVFKVYQQMCPISSDRVIRLVGAPEDILNCIVAVHEVIMYLKDIKSPREYDPNNFNELHAVNYGGWMSIDGRRHLAQLGGPPQPTKGPTESGRSQPMMMYNPSPQFFPGQPPPTTQQHPAPSFMGMPISHMADYVHPDCVLMELQQEMFQQQQQQQGPPVVQPPPAPVPMPVAAFQPMAASGVEVSHVSLPNRLIGAIMGKGGTRINEIRETTGARIDVDKDVIPNSEDRIITIQGTREQIQHAQVLLQENVKKYGGRH